MGTSLYSLFSNNLDADLINIFILDGGIKSENRDHISEICSNFSNTSLYWVPMGTISKKIGIDVKTDRGSVSQFSRLFIGDVLSDDIERVLYLDCDTLVVSSLSELWNMDLNGNIISALSDAFSKYYRGNIGLKKNDIMFNSGVLLIDLKRWRSMNIKEKLINFISINNGRIQQGDQGILNAVLSDWVTPLDPCYNLVSIFYELTYKEIFLYRSPINFYSEVKIENARLHPVIVHFTSSFYSIRPWFKNSNHPLKDEWYKYYCETPWQSESLGIDNSNKKNLSISFLIMD